LYIKNICNPVSLSLDIAGFIPDPLRCSRERVGGARSATQSDERAS
jgi:hypothetical protein